MYRQLPRNNDFCKLYNASKFFLVKVVIYSSGLSKDKWADLFALEPISVIFPDVFSELEHTNADLVIDATGDYWAAIPPHIPVLVHSLYPLPHSNRCLVRACLWPGFLEKKCWEVAGEIDNINQIQMLLEPLRQQLIAVRDITGFIAPRILATIINEAAFALSEGIAVAADIDVAMRLGTNYPEGPVEWAKRIGVGKVYDLLEHLSQTDIRYKPCSGFIKILSNAS
jgi:3-hydroxybutyryl-CoA dehydrogenase